MLTTVTRDQEAPREGGHPVDAPRACACGAPITLPQAKYCASCRSQRRRKNAKYIPTASIDRRLTEIYQLRPGIKHGSEIPGMRDLVEKTGWPKWRLIHRARALGLARVKESPWSTEELVILHRFAWMSDDRIRLKLQSAGFARTRTAIHLKLRRERAKQNMPYYSATSLATMFGVDGHVITRWIRLGWLQARLRGTERTEQQGGDSWLIHERDVYRFILHHPTDFDLRKCDQLWILDLLTEGKIAA